MSTTKNRPRLVLIDGYSNIFRAYYAIRNLSSSTGEPTNAVFGFLQILRKLLNDEAPEHLGVALDVSSDTVRRDLYEDYKANRAPMPEDLKPQIPWIRKILEAHHIPLLEMEKYEADDVLGTMAKKAVAAGYDVTLISADKDLFQLVGNGVSMYHTGRDKLYDAALVEEDFGVPPSQVIDVLALMGDASDNVPGVPGIGEKGAKKLIAEHGSLATLLENIAEVKRKSYREGLENHRDQALLSQELVTIHTDLPIDFEPDRLVRDEPDKEALLEIYQELDFKTLAEELRGEGVGVEPTEPAEAIENADAWRERVAGLAGRIHVAAIGDGEALGEVLGLGVLDGDGQPVYADFGREGLRDGVLESLEGWVGDEVVTLVGHDLKEVLRLLGDRFVAGHLERRCRFEDTMLMSYLLLSEQRSHAFADVVQARLGQTPMTPKEAGFVKGARPGATDPLLLTYAAERVELPRRLAESLCPELEEKKLHEVYETIEEPLLPVLLEMEETGIELDVPYLETMSEELGAEIEELEKKILEVAGEDFNLNSPKQLGEVMFDKLGYPVLGRTKKTKAYKTDADTLEELANRGYDLPRYLLHYREHTKLKSTYVDALPLLVGEDGRLHTRFNQAVASTGRLSSARPNLQNIPVRGGVGQEIRRAFRARQGMALVVADYSQIELRVLAHIAQEKAMLEAFRTGEDIHAATAAAVFDVSPMLVNADQRRMAKVINFGIIYGMSAFGLARQLGISRPDAERFIAAYLERYPGVARYTEETVADAEETLEVKTLYGRIRSLPDIKSRNYQLRENAKRMAINARIQGTAADILKLAMIAVDERLRGERPDSRLLLTVHDELVVEAPDADAEEIGELVREEMTGVAELDVPLVVDVGGGATWYEAKA